MIEKNRRRLMLGVAIGHLILAALGASGVSLLPVGPLGQLIEDYYTFSGAGTRYGFFAPGVGVQIRARFDVFDVIDGQGQKTTTSLETAMNREANLRVNDLINTFWRSVDDPGLQSSLAASFAGKILARYPQARTVVVRFESFEPPSREEFRAGERPQWTPFYEVKFVYQAGPADQGAPR